MNTKGLISFLKRHILPNIPYVAIFWFANKLAEAYRLTAGDDVLEKLAGSMAMLAPVMQKPLFSFDAFDLAAGLAGAAILYGVVAVKRKNAKKYRKDVEYGSARWGRPSDIAPFMDKNSENNIILTATEGLTMSPRPKDPKYARNKNMLVIGGSGSGKTRFIIKPNLMQCRSKDYPVSFVVTDPKGLVSKGQILQTGSQPVCGTDGRAKRSIPSAAKSALMQRRGGIVCLTT
jgi:type IV secretion system protein VirD4